MIYRILMGMTAALWFASGVPVWAEKGEEGVVITLNSIGDRVRAQNPELAAARWRVREALGRHVQSGRLVNPELSVEGSHDPSFRERGLEIGFAQRFPVTDRLKREKVVTAIEVDAAEAEIREVERGLIAEAREGVVKVLAIRQRAGLVEKQMELSKELAGFLAEVAKKGEGSPLDAGQAKVEATSLVLEMRQLKALEVAEIGALKPLLGVRAGEPLYVGGALPEAVVPKVAEDVRMRPDYQAALLGARVAKESILLEKAKKYEDVEAGVFAGANRTEDAPEGYETEGIVGFRLTIPLPMWNRNEGGVLEAEAKAARMEKEVEALGRRIQLEASGARAEMEEWLALLNEIGNELLPQAEEQAKLAGEALEKGQGDVQSVFRAREKVMQLGGARLDALREFHLARVRYESSLAKTFND